MNKMIVFKKNESTISKPFDRIAKKAIMIEPEIGIKETLYTEEILENKNQKKNLDSNLYLIKKRKFFLFAFLRAITIDLLIIIFQNLKTFITNLYGFLRRSKNKQKKLIDFEKNKQNKSMDSEKNKQMVDSEKNKQMVDSEKNKQTLDPEKNKQTVDSEKNQQTLDSEKNQQTLDSEKNQRIVDSEKNQQNKPIKYRESVCETEVKQMQTSINETARRIVEQ